MKKKKDYIKELYKLVGVEPQYEDACKVEDKYWDNYNDYASKYVTFDEYMAINCGNEENCTTLCPCAYIKEIYPELTDSKLLLLIKLLMAKYDLYLCTSEDKFLVGLYKDTLLNGGAGSKSFIEAVTEATCTVWNSFSDKDKKYVKDILEN